MAAIVLCVRIAAGWSASLPSGPLFSGWTIGDAGESCDEACARTEKGQCRADRMNMVVTEAAFKSANNALASFGVKSPALNAFACGAGASDFASEAIGFAPFRYAGAGKKCRFHAGTGSPSTCAASQSGAFPAQRLCCCVDSTEEDRAWTWGANVTARCPRACYARRVSFSPAATPPRVGAARVASVPMQPSVAVPHRRRQRC